MRCLATGDYAACLEDQEGTMDAWLKIEEKCEGKTILTLSANDFGMIIRFTDGSCLEYIDGVLQLEER